MFLPFTSGVNMNTSAIQTSEFMTTTPFLTPAANTTPDITTQNTIVRIEVVTAPIYCKY